MLLSDTRNSHCAIPWFPGTFKCFFIVVLVVWGVNICKGKKIFEKYLPYFHVHISAENKVVVCNSIG